MKNKSIDFNSRVQLYYQIYDILKEEIMNNTYKPGDMLPTEEFLTNEFNVSRATVRRAIDLLRQEDIVVRKQGIGTFVKERKESQSLDHIVHFIEDMESKGYKVSTKVISNEIVEGTPEICRQLNIDIDEKLIKIVRVRFLEEKPFCIESAYLIESKCPEVHNHDFNNQSLRLFLEDECGIYWKRAIQNIYAKKAESKAKILELDSDEPILHIQRVSYDQYDNPGEFLNAYYRGDMYFLTAEINSEEYTHI